MLSYRKKVNMHIFQDKIFCDFYRECIDGDNSSCDNILTRPVRHDAAKEELPIAIFPTQPSCFREIKRCKECGGMPCICSSGGKWAAHCMECDNSIGEKGYHDNCADSHEQACQMWNELNK